MAACRSAASARCHPCIDVLPSVRSARRDRASSSPCYAVARDGERARRRPRSIVISEDESRCHRVSSSARVKPYTHITIRGTVIRAVRWISLRDIGPLPGKVVFHCLCGNHWCANPRHFEVVTPKQATVPRMARLHRAVEARGGHCLDAQWNGFNGHKYRIVCAAGHQFTKDARGIYKGSSFCPQCDAAQYVTRLQAAAERGGARCLDTKWMSRDAKYQLVCATGHEFTQVGRSILRDGPACPQCEGATRIDRLRAALKSQGARCADAEWRGARAKYHIICAVGHKGLKRAIDILGGKVACSKCSAAPALERRLSSVRRVAAERRRARLDARSGLTATVEATIRRGRGCCLGCGKEGASLSEFREQFPRDRPVDTRTTALPPGWRQMATRSNYTRRADTLSSPGDRSCSARLSYRSWRA